MTDPFGARLHAALEARGRLCAGIDPHAALLQAWGLPDDVSGLERFALGAVEALAPRVSVVKPQSAFYERFGSRGVAVLEQVVATARDAGALVLLDVKRGDIGSTTQAYADAYLDPASPLACDAITASPYLGFGSLDPLLDTARRHGAGVFVLALTSNLEGPEVQHATVEGGGTVAGRILDHLRVLNTGAEPLGSFGAVVGATLGEVDEDLAVNGPILAPGYGAQGGTTADLLRIFGSAAPHVLASTSRDLLRHGPDPARLRAAADRASDELAVLGETALSRVLAVVLASAVVTIGCASDQERYCASVEDHQAELTEILAQGGDRALIDALPSFRALADDAPADIDDEWRMVIERIAALEERLVAAGVDPASYAADDPPPGLTDEDADAIAAAARGVGAPETRRALADLEQQALDVCRTPLTR